MTRRTKLIGRSRELDRVRAAVRAGDQIAITGPAGIGKTTLVESALEGVAHARGTGLKSLHSTPYFALELAVRRALEGTPEEVAAQVLACIGRDPLFVDDLHWTHPATSHVLAVLRGRVPVIVTARPSEIGTTHRALLREGCTVRLDSLDEDASRRVLTGIHPCLDRQAADRTLELAEGNPLLLAMLPLARGEPAADLTAALHAMLAACDEGTSDAARRLALLGRPAPPAVIGAATFPPGLVTVDDGLVWFAHPLFAEVVGAQADRDRVRYHADLARALPPAEAAEHHLRAGDACTARDLSLAAADASDSAERARQLLLAVAADEEMGVEDDARRFEATRALIAAQRFDDARGVLAGLGDQSTEQARFLLGQVLWFSGDVDGAARVLESAAADADPQRPTPVAARIASELAYLRIRHRLPGAADAARRALELSESAGEGVLRARALVAVTMAYELAPGWEAMLRSITEEARRGNDLELEMITSFHLSSGLGLMGRLGDANHIHRRQAQRAERAGLVVWQSHFESALLLNLALAGSDQEWVVDAATEMLSTRPRFRNWTQAAVARILAATDLRRYAVARAEAEDLLASVRDAEDVVWACVAAGAVAAVIGDHELMDRCLERSRTVGDAYFGLRIAVELDAQHLAASCPGPDRAPPEPLLPSFTLPLLWPAVVEAEAFAHARLGDRLAAAERFGEAAEGWRRHEIPRLAARAKYAEARVLIGVHPERARRARRAAVELARASGLGALLDSWDEPAVPGLSRREAEVLAAVALGASSKEIGRDLDLSPRTVDAYVRSACRKLGAGTRSEAALLLMEGK